MNNSFLTPTQPASPIQSKNPKRPSFLELVQAAEAAAAVVQGEHDSDSSQLFMMNNDFHVQNLALIDMSVQSEGQPASPIIAKAPRRAIPIANFNERPLREIQTSDSEDSESSLANVVLPRPPYLGIISTFISTPSRNSSFSNFSNLAQLDSQLSSIDSELSLTDSE